MRRLAILAAAALACSPQTESLSDGPGDTFFYPSGLAVVDHDLLVASSNADLTYASDTGGTVIAVDPVPDPATLLGSVNIQSFSGELGIAAPAACPALPAGAGATAFVPVRGKNLLYRIAVGAGGALTCEDCALAVGASDRADPFSIGIACDTATTPGGPSVARAYVGYIKSSLGQSWVTQLDLTKAPTDDGYVQHTYYDIGQVRAFAYDASRRRLYLTRTVSGSQSSLRYVDLANGCRIDRTFAYGGCRSATTRDGAVPTGLELRGIALANETDPQAPVRRAYVTARIYDAAAAASAGARVGDFDGLLLVVDLAEDAGGRVEFRILDQIPIGHGAGDVRVLPRGTRTGRDVVAAMAEDDGVLWIYDDETGGLVPIGRSPVTGAPILGHGPAGMTVDPAPLEGTNTARVYVASFREHFVTPIDVPLDDPAAAGIPLSAGAPRRIGGGVTP